MIPLIAGKVVAEFTAVEYHEFIKSMYYRKALKAKSPVPGISVGRTKTGKLSLRRTVSRSFAYVTLPEIAILAKAHQLAQSDLWNLFKQKGWITGQDRLDCEATYASIKEIPF